MVAKGYKNTEIGVIPEDWELVKLDDVVDKFINGGTPSTLNSSYWIGNIPWITGQDIFDQKIKVVRRYISDRAVKESSTNVIKKGNLLFVSRTGVGKVAIAPFDIAISQDFTGIYCNKKIINTDYLYKYLDSMSNILQNLNQGTSIQGVTRIALSNFQIPIPPKPEQLAIATALSDADALISSTEKLIAKKKAIKQGAMQELLKPKEGWEEKSFGEVSEINMGQSPDSRFYNNEHKGLPLLQGNADIKDRMQVIRFWTENTTKTCDEGDLIMTVRAPVGLVGIAKHKSCIGRRICSIKSKSINKLFLYHLLVFNEEHWKETEQGSTFTSANFLQIFNFIVSFPKSKSEQTRIATILSDMDAEISLLERKLEKQKQIKQGMMRDLLTGKIRLPGNKEKQVKKPKHNKPINEAVIISFLVHKFGTEKYPLSRFRYTKYAYLLHRQSEREARGFDKHAAGPYNPANRYKGAEGIALKNKYIAKVQNPTSKNDAFVVNKNIERALNYFTEWYGTEIPQWIEQFKFYKNEYLEVLTTVDKAICELIQKKITLDVPNIKVHIASIPQWKKKLEKPYFSDKEIQKAIDESNRLFGNG